MSRYVCVKMSVMLVLSLPILFSQNVWVHPKGISKTNTLHIMAEFTNASSIVIEGAFFKVGTNIVLTNKSGVISGVSINGKSAHGVRSGLPLIQIVKAKIIERQREIDLDCSGMFGNLPNSNIFCFGMKSNIFGVSYYSTFGDGIGGYQVNWILSNGVVMRTVEEDVR